MIPSELLFALNRLKSLSLQEKLKVMNAFPSIQSFKSLTLYELEWILNRKTRIRSFHSEKLLDNGGEDLAKTVASSTNWTWFGAPEYPAVLKNIYDPPFLLFWKGTLPPEETQALAVVGTRQASLEADRAAFALGLDAGESGIPLISGMAKGIDGSGHQGCLTANGKTWAVLGTGCDRPYPESHRRLAAAILSRGGGLLSEFIPGTGPARYNFPQRNRIISGLSQAVVIVQAPKRSGALYTADFALDQGRDVYVHEAGLSGIHCQGTAALAEQGATVIQSLGDIFPQSLSPEHALLEDYALAAGSCEEAARHASLLTRKELSGELKFYKGRVQY